MKEKSVLEIDHFQFATSPDSLIKLSEVQGGGTDLNDLFKINNDERKRIPMSDLEYYTMHSVIRRGLWFKAFSIAGKGFTLVHENQAALKICNDFISTPNYKRNLATGVFQAFGYGEGYVENLWNDTFTENKNITVINEDGTILAGTAITDPKTFMPVADNKGVIKEYIQKIIDKHGSEKKIFFPARRIMFIKFDQVGGDVRGYGLVEPAIPVIKGLIIGRKTRFNRLYRMGNPFLHATYKSKEMQGLTNKLDLLQGPEGKKQLTPKQMLYRELKDINEKSLLITSDLYEMKWLGAGDQSEDLTPIMTSLYQEAAGSLGVPLALLTQSGERENRAVLDRISIWDFEEIGNYQEMLGEIIAHQQLRPLLDANGFEDEDLPDIQWNESSEDKTKMAFENDEILTRYLAQGVQSGIIPAKIASKILGERLGMMRETEMIEGVSENKPTEPLPQQPPLPQMPKPTAQPQQFKKGGKN